jgi:hypothetical protein
VALIGIFQTTPFAIGVVVATIAFILSVGLFRKIKQRRK